jgi:hypothetical protein
LGGIGCPARKAGKLAAICEPTVYRKFGSLEISQPYMLSWPVTGIAFPFHSSMALQPFVGPWPILQLRTLFYIDSRTP